MTFGRPDFEAHRAIQQRENAARRTRERKATMRALVAVPPRTLHRAVMGGSCTGVVQEKQITLQHQGYMAIVRRMPCAHCGRPAPSQFCHADMNKGTGIKTDCRRGFPGCPECHVLLGSSGKIPRAERRLLEEGYGTTTRATVLLEGLWPVRLPRWEEARR